MHFSGPVLMWLLPILAGLFYLLIAVTIGKLLQVLFKLNNVLDDIQEYIRRRL